MTASLISTLTTVTMLTAVAACTTDGSNTLTSRDCFIADRVVSWETHDGRALDVTDNRGDHFRIHFCNACSGLEDAITLDFHGGTNGLMCGDEDEVVRIRGASCRVSSVMRVSPQAEELDVTSCD